MAAAAIIMAAVAVMGQLSQAQQAKNQAKAEENAHLYNEAVARNDSTRALNESTARQLQFRRERSQMLGTQRAAAAQTGTGFGGSTGDVLDRTSTLSELDALNIAYEGEVRSQGFLAQADLENYYARVARSKRPTTFGTLLAAGQAGGQAYFGAVRSLGGAAAGGRSVLTSGGYNGSSLNSYGTVRYG